MIRIKKVKHKKLRRSHVTSTAHASLQKWPYLELYRFVWDPLYIKITYSREEYIHLAFGSIGNLMRF